MLCCGCTMLQDEELAEPQIPRRSARRKQALETIYLNRVASLAVFKPNFSFGTFSKEVWHKKCRCGLLLISDLLFCFFEEKHRKSEITLCNAC